MVKQICFDYEHYAALSELPEPDRRLVAAQANHADDPIEALAIASDPSERECYPCGQCRQVLVDVERRQGTPLRVIMSGGGTASVVSSATLLLPFTFKL